MSTINAVGNGLTGATGTGNFVGSTSPTLVTPTLGVATATSITFGGGVLSTYTTSTSWTPAITFDTPGNLSVSYNSQVGHYLRIGNLLYLTFSVNWSPTFTTSSGNLKLTGLPFTGALDGIGAVFTGDITFPSSDTMVVAWLPAGNNFLNFVGSKSAGGYSILGTASTPTTGTYQISGTVITSV